jgi:hypothetical protein
MGCFVICAGIGGVISTTAGYCPDPPPRITKANARGKPVGNPGVAGSLMSSSATATMAAARFPPECTAADCFGNRGDAGKTLHAPQGFARSRRRQDASFYRPHLLAPSEGARRRRGARRGPHGTPPHHHDLRPIREPRSVAEVVAGCAGEAEVSEAAVETAAAARIHTFSIRSEKPLGPC